MCFFSLRISYEVGTVEEHSPPLRVERSASISGTFAGVVKDAWRKPQGGWKGWERGTCWRGRKDKDILGAGNSNILYSHPKNWKMIQFD